MESLCQETENMGIKVLLIEPGRFRTNLLSSGNVKTVQSKIADYAETSTKVIEGLAQENHSQPGDTEKGVAIILDLVRKEGCVAGRDIPLRMPLGTDCFKDIKEKCEETLKMLDEWATVINSTNH